MFSNERIIAIGSSGIEKDISKTTFKFLRSWEAEDPEANTIEYTVSVYPTLRGQTQYKYRFNYVKI